jgi:hypothetical protein
VQPLQKNRLPIESSDVSLSAATGDLAAIAVG